MRLYDSKGQCVKEATQKDVLASIQSCVEDDPDPILVEIGKHKYIWLLGWPKSNEGWMIRIQDGDPRIEFRTEAATDSQAIAVTTALMSGANSWGTEAVFTKVKTSHTLERIYKSIAVTMLSLLFAVVVLSIVLIRCTSHG